MNNTLSNYYVRELASGYDLGLLMLPCKVLVCQKRTLFLSASCILLLGAGLSQEDRPY